MAYTYVSLTWVFLITFALVFILPRIKIKKNKNPNLLERAMLRLQKIASWKIGAIVGAVVLLFFNILTLQIIYPVISVAAGERFSESVIVLAMIPLVAASMLIGVIFGAIVGIATEFFDKIIFAGVKMKRRKKTLIGDISPELRHYFMFSLLVGVTAAVIAVIIGETALMIAKDPSGMLWLFVYLPLIVGALIGWKYNKLRHLVAPLYIYSLIEVILLFGVLGVLKIMQNPQDSLAQVYWFFVIASPIMAIGFFFPAIIFGAIGYGAIKLIMRWGRKEK